MKPIQSNALKEVNQEVVNQWGIVACFCGAVPHRLTCFLLLSEVEVSRHSPKR